MNFEDLVPPLELCKLIPAGEFKDSVFIWGYSCDKRNAEPFVDERDCVEYCRRNMVNAPSMFPAPTLEEIMSAIPFCRVYKKTNGAFIAVHKDTRIAHMNAADAAMHLWLKTKGIDYE